MITLPIRKVHNHKKVWTHQVMDSMSATESLCTNCDAFGPNNLAPKCPIAGQLLLLHKLSDVAVAVTRCPIWRLKKEPV
ncbi:hypothetical protein LCGC14_1873160 [marine sediment metagenome]|uniref:Uncharacterized protein n=1 Tax=marine sediment metagenome TaxID=412755 RepID=A0A0F9J345_9ZZZZ